MLYKILSFLIAIFVVTACSPETQADLMITGVHIIDVETGNIAENQTIEIRDAKIAAIYDTDVNFTANDTLRVSGKYVIPGLWDMHVHFRGRRYTHFGKQGIT